MMRRVLATITSLGVLALAPGVASAEGNQQQGGNQGTYQGGSTLLQQQGQNLPQTGGGFEIRPQAPTSIVATVKGTVTGLNLSRGLITISSGAGNVTLNALPAQIADLNPGDLVALNYLNYGGVRWLALSQGGQAGTGGTGGAGGMSGNLDPSTFSQYGTVTGYVSQLNKSTGMITVRGIPFRTHPQFLENVLPGQFVNVTFAQVGGVNWAQGIGAAGGPSQSQGGQQGNVGGAGNR